MSETTPPILEEDISLQWPRGCEPAQIDALLRTLAVQTIELSERIQRVHNRSGGLGDLDAAQQICQVLSSSTQSVPVPGVLNLVHALDEALQDLIDRQSLPDPAQADILLAAAECLEEMHDVLQGLGAPPGMPPQQASTVLQQLRDWAQNVLTATAAGYLDEEAAQQRLLELAGQHSTLAARLGALLDQYQPLIRQWEIPLRGTDTTTDSHFETLDALFESLYRLQQRYRQLNQATEQAIYSLAAQPLATLGPALRLTVLEGCAELDRQAELQIRGDEMLVDPEVLQALEQPIIQLLLNALEHGIEPEAERRAAGKPPIGQIILQASQQGSTLILRCEDDGRGLQLDDIRSAAELSGLIRPDQPLSEHALTQLILQSGFSRRSRHEPATPGLSRVHEQIRQLRGLLHIDNRPGQGCTFELRIPMHRVAAKLLRVQSGDMLYGIHERGLLEVIPPGTGRTLQDEQGLLRYRLEGAHYPAHLLETLLRQAVTDPGIEQRTALLVQGDDGQRHIILVEAFRDTSERVVQPAGRFVPRMPGLLGVSQLGEEPFLPVIDAASLFGQLDSDMTTGELSSGFQALLVDDSPSVLQSLSQVLTSAGLSVRTANDAQEALIAIGQTPPDIALIDLEMPSMDGLELIQRLRSQPRTQHLPIIVLTARGTPAQLEEAEKLGIFAYLIKPVSNNELLKQLERALNPND